MTAALQDTFSFVLLVQLTYFLCVECVVYVFFCKTVVRGSYVSNYV